jgi:hypothetical protein
MRRMSQFLDVVDGDGASERALPDPPITTSKRAPSWERRAWSRSITARFVVATEIDRRVLRLEDMNALIAHSLARARARENSS